MNVLQVSLQQTILVLHARGWSRRRIARELGIHRKTVAAYVDPAKWPISTAGSELAGGPKPAISTAGSPEEAGSAKAAISTAGSAGRVSLCREFLPAINTAVAAGLSAKRIHQDLAADHGFTGSYESVKRCVRGLVQRLELPHRRLECAPGEEMQVDFGQGAWIEAEGRRRRPHLFRAVLSHSRKGYSEVVWRQDTETFIRCCENAYRHLGGVTRTTVVDNLKAAVLDADWFDPNLNPKMADFARHYGTTVLPTQPARPEHKGKIEAGIKFAQNNALKGRSFSSLAEQNLFLADWERRVADTRIHGTVRQQVGALFAAERPALSPLPESLFPSFVEARRKVHRDGHVEFDKAYYSVPPEYLGREVWVRGESRVIRILNHRQEVIAAHARAEPGRFATAEAHIHAHKRSGVERGAEYWLGRCRLIGPNTAAWAEGLFAQRGVYGLRALQGLVSLAKQHPSAALEQAAATATRRGVSRLRDLRRLLTEGDTVVQVDFLETHPLIRPLEAYSLTALSQT
ncbi:MAG TPA: IS21 family transposase [Gemmatimonadales bacterium]|nr:IS21 family transposase [Gemmatimonadales bacterium]